MSDCLASGKITNSNNETILSWHGRAYLRGTVLESVAEEKRPELSKNFGDYGTNSEAEITAVNKGYEDSFAQFAEGAFKTLVYEGSFFNKLSAISETHFDRTVLHKRDK